MKRYLSALLLLQICFGGASCSDKEPAPAPAALVSSVTGTYPTPFLGFGYNQYPPDLNADGSDNFTWTPDRYRMMEERIRAIRPGLVRMPVLREWYNPSFKVGEYDWETEPMKAFYKFMDLYKEMGVAVLSGWWHVTDYETDKDGYRNDANVTAFADFINYMIRVKGYDNIIHMQPSNEPYGTYTQFSDWSNFMRKTYDLCVAKGYPADRLCGPDSWDDWVGRAAEANSRELVSYNFHFYFDGTASSSESLGLYDQLMLQMNQVVAHDPSNKPVVCGEVGAINGSWLDWPANAPEGAIHSYDYIYGVYMIDYAIQSMQAGVASSLSWGLHGFDQNKDAGMWNNTGNFGGTKLRPLYYAWSLLCRYFPPQSVCLRMSQMTGKIKVGGVYAGGGNYSFVVSNRATYDDVCTIRLPHDSRTTYYVYSYTEESQGDGVQLSLVPQTVTTEGSIALEVPANSAVFATTLPPLE